MVKQTHPEEVAQIYETILSETPAEGRFIEIGAGRKIHIIEAGTGPPLVMLHGTGTAAYSMMPLLEHLQGVRAIIPDRPGNGLSDPVDFGSKGYRDTAVEVTDQILDALELDQVVLGGNSGGSVWAIWYALAYPARVTRLALVGSTPLLPKTQAPLPLRVMTTPIIGDILARMPANEQMVVQLMKTMGEGKTIVNYPKVIEGVVASNNDPLASRTNREELSAFMNLWGFRTGMRIRADDLAKLQMPTLIVWGEHDPLGGADVARATCDAIRDCRLELLSAGHVPMFGHPEQTTRLIMNFVHSA